MAYDAFWIEDFRGWAPTVNLGVGGFTGLGWTNGTGSPSVSMPQIVANTRFNSGKALRYSSGTFGVQYALPTIAAVARVYSWNQIRNADYTGAVPANDNLGVGMHFFTGVGGKFIRICPNTSAVGLGGQYMLQTQNVAGATFQTLAVSPIIPIGVKVSMAITFDPLSGSVTWHINDSGVPIYSGIVPGMAGATFTAIQFGRITTGAATGECDWSDFWGFVSGVYPGPTEVRSAFPAANLPLQDWTPVGGTAVAVLGNTFAVTPAAYIESATPGNVSQFTAPVSNTNVVAIYSASHEYYASRTEAGAVTLNGQVGDAGVFTDGATVIPPQTTYQRFADYFGRTNPNTGLNWTAADMANNQLGYERT